MNNISKPFYLGSYLVSMIPAALLSLGALVAAGGGRLKEDQLPFAVLGALISIYAFVVFLVLLYKMWKAVPATVVRTTPGRAVGFMFIPVFNLYWWFPALAGWARNWNAYAAKSEQALPGISEAIPIAIGVFTLLGNTIGTIASFAGVSWLGAVLGSPNYVLLPIFIAQVCNRLNAIPAADYQAAMAPRSRDTPAGSRGLGIASMILGILAILLPYLGLISGIVAVILAAKQRRVYREPLSMVGLITGIVGMCLWGLTILVLVIVISTMSMR